MRHNVLIICFIKKSFIMLVFATWHVLPCIHFRESVNASQIIWDTFNFNTCPKQQTSGATS